MGVSAAGKTAVGQATAAVLGLDFVDGDDLHPPANVAKMASGQPLSDGDRQPWLDRIGRRLASSADGIVIACSALKATYRTQIRTQATNPSVSSISTLPGMRSTNGSPLAPDTSCRQASLTTITLGGPVGRCHGDRQTPLDDVVNAVLTSLR